jgi:DNA-binding CsgD family transcriptional regulator
MVRTVRTRTPLNPTLRIQRGDPRLTIRRAGRTLLLDEEIATLTRGEREIVDELAEGRSNAEIAKRLNIAPTTVRKHLESIYAKLDVSPHGCDRGHPWVNASAQVNP